MIEFVEILSSKQLSDKRYQVLCIREDKDTGLKELTEYTLDKDPNDVDMIQLNKTGHQTERTLSPIDKTTDELCKQKSRANVKKAYCDEFVRVGLVKATAISIKDLDVVK